MAQHAAEESDGGAAPGQLSLRADAMLHYDAVHDGRSCDKGLSSEYDCSL